MASNDQDLFAPAYGREQLLGNASPRMAFDPDADFWAWRGRVDSKLRELLGSLPAKVPLDLKVDYERETELCRELWFVFSSEPHVDVPCHLLIPREGEEPFPAVICLQGHTTGMHLSLGRPKCVGDAESIAQDDDFALQAVRQGYAALAMEQRWFGERKDSRTSDYTLGCHHATMTALLLGRTTIGERVWDVMRAVVARHVANQELTVEAALTGNRSLALQALVNDPLLRELESAEPMLDEMLEANRRHLPKFFRD
ncbi:MAG: alpha/beta hydrolase family protein [Anaerolineae bacterium]|jgi:cephalosporin-C deacetylase-like acetyl esterase